MNKFLKLMTIGLLFISGLYAISMLWHYILYIIIAIGILGIIFVGLVTKVWCETEIEIE
jgi:hypothetical protein